MLKEFVLKNKKYLLAVEYILNVPYRLLFPLIRAKVKKSTTPKKYYFSVCCIFKDEADYLKEWIEYNRIIGVDHLYMYNNNSSDGFLRIISPYIDCGYVTLVEWTKPYSQMEAYENCYVNHKGETNWLAFWDIDEFVCPLQDTDIKDFLKRYEGYPAIMIYWQMFGTNGLLQSDKDKLVIEQFTCAWDHLDGIGKIILSTHDSYSPTHIYHHHMYCRYCMLGFSLKIPMITEHRKFVFFPQIYKAPTKNSIQLNHYFSKSYGEFQAKLSKGDVARNENEEIRKKTHFFYNHEQCNKVENKNIFRFLIKLKLALQK